MFELLAPALALSLLALGPAPGKTEAGVHAEARPEAAPGSIPASASGSASDAIENELEAVALETGDEVLDTTLSCGLRVLIARDASLPVAALVLSIEVGTTADPDALPGLVHALAYHLQQGNPELAPGEGIATAHDAGGLASMAVGLAQVRFESLIPVSELDAMLRVESQRLRAPNVGRELWLKSLSYARNDDDLRTLVPLPALAAAWGDPRIDHDGREVDARLGDLLDQSVGAQLSRLFDYRDATLVIVGPDDPKSLLARVTPLFAGLPAHPRAAPPELAPPAPSSDGPRVLPLPRQRGDSLLWAVPGTPNARAWAQVLCGTLNRQQRGEGDPPKARVRCIFAEDARRPALILRALGYDPETGPEPLIAARLERIAALAEVPGRPAAPAPPADAGSADPAQLEAGDPDQPEVGDAVLAALLEAQRVRLEGDIAFATRTPLDLATYLASATEITGAEGVTLRTRAEVLGLPTLGPDSSSAAAALVAAIPTLLDTRAAVLLVDPEQLPPPITSVTAKPDTDTDPGTNPAADPAAPAQNPAEPDTQEAP